jgi:16S rRNA pseudouridine516 synthase
LLIDDTDPVHAVSVTQLSTHRLEMVIDEGRYHQIRRMLGAVGNRVETLHRQQVGNLILGEDLQEGTWQSIALEQVVMSA